MLKVILIFVVIIVVLSGSLVATIHFSNEKISTQAGQISTLQTQLAASEKDIQTMEADSIATKLNQDWLNTQLNDIREESQKVQNTVVIPKSADASAAALQKYLNTQTSSVLSGFEALTKNAK